MRVVGDAGLVLASGRTLRIREEFVHPSVRALPGRLSDLSVFHSRSVVYGAFVWVRRALNIQKRRFPARAGRRADGQAAPRVTDDSAGGADCKELERPTWEPLSEMQ